MLVKSTPGQVRREVQDLLHERTRRQGLCPFGRMS